MKVLHVIGGLGVGGAESMLTALVGASGEGRPRQTVVDLFDGGPNAEVMRSAGVPVTCLGLKRRLPDPRAVFRMAAILRRQRPAVVQSWMYYADLAALWGLRLAGRNGTRLYWGVRCSDMDLARYGWALCAAVRACARLSDRPDGIVANSERGLEVHRAMGYRPRQSAVVPNGIDTECFRPRPGLRDRLRAELDIAPEAFVAVCPARVDPMKDHATLLEAAGRMPAMIFVLAGLGTEALGAPPNVRALGLRDDLSALYAAADAVLSTSAYGEGFSNTIAEGMACGLPAVATAVGDAERIVGDAGTVVPIRDPDAVAAALQALSALPAAERRALGDAARARIATRYSLAAAVAAFDRIHRDGIGACAGS